MSYDIADLKAYANHSAETAGVPADLFARLINAESSWNPEAVSSAGAEGIAQIVPSDHPGVNTFNPFESLDYAANYLKQLYDRFGSWTLAVAAYNAGPGAVHKYGGVPPYPETQSYVSKILGTGGGSSNPPFSKKVPSSRPPSEAL